MLCFWCRGAGMVRVERFHHQFIAQVLHALDGPMLREFNCLFGGGTAIALRYGEYRESVDIDFLVSDVQSYRGLRQSLAGPSGIKAIMLDFGNPTLAGWMITSYLLVGAISAAVGGRLADLIGR